MAEVAESPVELTTDNVLEHVKSDDDLRALEESISPPASEPKAPESQDSAPAAEKQEPSAPEAQGGQDKHDMTDEDMLLWKELKAVQDIAGTPYKTLADFVKGYKSLQGEYTKTRDTIKPHEAIVDRLSRDQRFRETVEQAALILDNPSLAEAYARQMSPGDPRPDPRMYDLNDSDQFARYNQDVEAWTARQLDSRINTRLGQIEQGMRMQTFANDFKSKYPNVQNPDDLLSWSQQNVPRLNPYEIAYRLREFDNIRGQIEAQVRQEYSKRLTETQKKTPQGTAPSKEAGVTEVLEHIARYGESPAIKRYGKENVDRAMRQLE